MSARKRPGAKGRLFAVGDIHGCPDELEAMLRTISPQSGDTVVFIGDYVDRGPSTRDVIDRCLDFERASEADVVFLKGNHEDMLLAFLGLSGSYGESFLYNGGVQTLESYGVSEDQLDHAVERMPEAHLHFLGKLATSYLHPPYLFVHAGILPGRQLEEQQTEDLLWIRQEFIFSPHNLGRIVVFGHTPMRSVLVDLPYKIGIDTGLVYGGKLTCVELVEGVTYQVARGSRSAKTGSLSGG